MIIEPTEFDLVVLGTGLEASLIAGAAGKSGKKVLQLDASSVYGDLSATLTLQEFLEWSKSHKDAWTRTLQNQSGGNDVPFEKVPVEYRQEVYRNHVSMWREDFDVDDQKGFNIDLNPKVTYCSGPLVQTLLLANAHQYIEYRLIDESFVLRDGVMQKVPASRADVFRDRTLGVNEKRLLTNFLKSIVAEVERRSIGQDQTDFGDITFCSWLEEQGLTPELADLIQYAVAFKDSNEGVTAAEGFEALCVYLKSMGRYKTDSGPFMVPYYACGDVPQAFCRVCAVNGGVYVLRCSAISLLIDPTSKACKGIQTEFGQNIMCSSIAASGYLLGGFMGQVSEGEKWIARAICVTDKSLLEGLNQIFLVIPPGSGDIGNAECIHVLQMGTPVCPEGRFLVYFTMKPSGGTAQSDLQAAVRHLFKTAGLRSAGGSQNEASAMPSSQDTPDARPSALFLSYYDQRVIAGGSDADLPANVGSCGGPDGQVGYELTLNRARSAFRRLFGELEFFPVPEAAPGLVDSDEEALDDLEAELSGIATTQ